MWSNPQFPAGLGHINWRNPWWKTSFYANWEAAAQSCSRKKLFWKYVQNLWWIIVKGSFWVNLLNGNQQWKTMSSQVFFQRADVRKCSSKYVLLKISKYLQESTSALRPATLLKRDSNTGMLCEYCEIFKKPFFVEHLRWLLLFSKSLSNLDLNCCCFLEAFIKRCSVKKAVSGSLFP